MTSELSALRLASYGANHYFAGFFIEFDVGRRFALAAVGAALSSAPRLVGLPAKAPRWNYVRWLTFYPTLEVRNAHLAHSNSYSAARSAAHLAL
jgi:hypothetical protein